MTKSYRGEWPLVLGSPLSNKPRIVFITSFTSKDLHQIIYVLCFSLATESLANKMKDMQSGQSVDISNIMKVEHKKSTLWVSFPE